MYESLSTEIKSLDLKLAEKEKEVVAVPHVEAEVSENIAKETEELKLEITELKKQLDKELNDKKLLENELKRFIKELKGK